MFGWRKKDDDANKRTEVRVAVETAKVQVGSDECKVVEWSREACECGYCELWCQEQRGM